MKTYNSYQEAQIENPKYPIGIDSNGKFLVISSEIDNHPGTVAKCDPSNHCFTVEEFLNSGHRFVIGDIYWSFGPICTVGCGVDVKYANTSHHNDKNCFVLKAKALSKASNEESEWDGNGLPPAGTECECFDFTLDKWFKVKTLDAKTESGEIAVTSINNHKRYAKLFWGCKFRKIGSEQQRKERLRIEAAYDLYVLAQSAIDGEIIDYSDFVKESRQMQGALAIVDKTGYRVEGDKDGSVPVQANKLPENSGSAISVNDETGSSIQLCIADAFNAHKLFNHYRKVNDIEGQMHIEVFTGNAHLCANWVSILEKAKELLKEGE